MHVRTPAALLALLPFLGHISVSWCSPLETREYFDVSQHLGNLSPYFSAPTPYGVKSELPGDCTVDQVVLVRVILILIVLFNFMDLMV